MLEVPLVHITAIATARSARELQPYLQGALELEIAVIPPYLTALYSLFDGKNNAIREILRSAVVDEMLHVALIANILNAMHCSPILSPQSLARGYPARLPLGATGIGLELRKFSLDFVHDVFLTPDESTGPTLRLVDPILVGRPYGTLGQFYRAIIGKIEELGDIVFTGDPAFQFVDEVSYSERELFRVCDARSAIRALRLVLGQGNHAGGAPIDSAGSARSHRLQQIAGTPGSDAIPFDVAGVINVVENSRTSMYPLGSPVRIAVDAFNVAYCSILAALNETFNGKPERYELAVSSMYGLTSLARSIVAIDRGDGTFAAPSFEWSE
jgi:hypothetical protein